MIHAATYELRALLAPLRDPGFPLALLAGLLLWTLSYQAPFSQTIHIGGDPRSQRREDDLPFLQDSFNGSQPDVKGEDWWLSQPYRWTSATSRIALPGVGGGPWVLTLTAASGRADGSAVGSQWLVGDQQVQLPIAASAPAMRRYHLLTRGSARGDLELELRTPPYKPPNGDPRELGFVLSEMRLTAAGASPRMPALGQLGWLTLTLALVYCLGRRLGITRQATLALAMAAALLLALLLLRQRLALTVFTPTLAGVLAGCYLLAALLSAGGARWRAEQELQLVSWFSTLGSRPVLFGLLVLAFGLRVGGLLHPHTIYSDLRLNANNLLELSLGQLYFTQGLPDDAGGGDAPYPPGMYVMLAPLQLFAPPSMDHRLLLLKIAVALLDSLVVGLVWLLLLRQGRRAALLGAALYLAPPPILSSFSIGEFANIGGQVLALPLLALLVAGNWQKETGSRQKLATANFYLLPAFCIALLGHLGVVISLISVLACLWLVWGWAGLRWGGLWRGRLLGLTGAGLLAAVAVGLCYYSFPTFLDLFAARLGRSGSLQSVAAVPQVPAAERLLVLLQSLLTPGTRLQPLLLVLGLIWLVDWRSLRTDKPADGLRSLLLAWWLGTLLSLGLLLFANQGVRWQHFLYPALCLGAGPTLAALWRRGGAGRATAAAATLFPICYGVVFWVARLRDYLHP